MVRPLACALLGQQKRTAASGRPVRCPGPGAHVSVGPASRTPRACAAVPVAWAWSHRYVGGAQIHTGVAALAPAAPADGPAAPADAEAGADAALVGLDGELAQALRHLSKRDAITKVKALQVRSLARPPGSTRYRRGPWPLRCTPPSAAPPAVIRASGHRAACTAAAARSPPRPRAPAPQKLRQLLPSRSPAEVAAALPAWLAAYRLLVMDASRAVRAEAAGTLGEVLRRAGRAVAPHLRPLAGPLWLAQHDPHAPAAAASRAAFAEAFPSPAKRTAALLHARASLAAYLTEALTASAAQLGDPRCGGRVAGLGGLGRG
jgi:hypothetical protein